MRCDPQAYTAKHFSAGASYLVAMAGNWPVCDTWRRKDATTETINTSIEIKTYNVSAKALIARFIAILCRTKQRRLLLLETTASLRKKLNSFKMSFSLTFFLHINLSCDVSLYSATYDGIYLCHLHIITLIGGLR